MEHSPRGSCSAYVWLYRVNASADLFRVPHVWHARSEDEPTAEGNRVSL